MATVNPSVWSAANTRQDLYTIEFPFPRVPQYQSKGSSVPLTFETIVTQVGTDIDIDTINGAINLVGGITYNISITADITGGQGKYQLNFYDEGQYVPVAPPGSGGFTQITTVTPADDARYYITVSTDNGDLWTYPSQVLNASVTVTAVSGFEA